MRPIWIKLDMMYRHYFLLLAYFLTLRAVYIRTKLSSPFLVRVQELERHLSVQ
jgi:hypothetical protein